MEWKCGRGLKNGGGGGGGDISQYFSYAQL